MLKALFGRGWSWRAACRSRCGQQINRAGVRIRLSTIRTKPAATRSITSRLTAVETVAAIGEAQFASSARGVRSAAIAPRPFEPKQRPQSSI